MRRRRILPVISLNAIKREGSVRNSSSGDRVETDESNFLSRVGADDSTPPSSNMGNSPFSLGRKSRENEAHVDASKANNSTSNDSSYQLPLQISSNGELQSKYGARPLALTDRNKESIPSANAFKRNSLFSESSSSSTHTPTKRLPSANNAARLDRNTIGDTITPSESCNSSSSSVEVSTKKTCPSAFQCTRCQGDVRMPPLATGDSTPISGETCSNASSDEAEPVICCSTPFCKSRYHLKCSGVPQKSQIYYNSINSHQKKPLSPGSVKSIDTAWWNIPIRNNLQQSYNTEQQLLPSDALFGSFQLYDEDRTSSVSSYMCPGCDVEGTSRYLLEYFELFHAMKKTYYSRSLDDNAPNRRDKMSECVEARTGGGFIKYLARMHAIDCQQDDYHILDKCEASELNVTLMKNVLRFLKQQLTEEEQEQLMRPIVLNGNKEVIEGGTVEQSSTNGQASQEPVHEKKSKINVDNTKRTESLEASKGSGHDKTLSLDIPAQNADFPKKSDQTSATTPQKTKGICYHKNKKRWEVKSCEGRKSYSYIGSFKTYEQAVTALTTYKNNAAQNNTDLSTPSKISHQEQDSARDGLASKESGEVSSGCYKNKRKAEVLLSHTAEGSERSTTPKKPKVEDRKLPTQQSKPSYYSNRDKWIARLGTADGRKYLGAFASYKEASSAMDTYYRNKQKVEVQVIETGRTSDKKAQSLVEPASGFVLVQRGKLDSTYLVGMSIMLFNPVDNSYHSGRIVDYKQNASATKNSTSHVKSITTRLLDTEIAETLYLVRFREGAEGRKVAIHQWIYLEEHAVRVGGEVCWAKISDEIYVPDSSVANSVRMCPYRPVQIIFRSMLERISTLKDSEGYRNVKSNGDEALDNEACRTSVLAMGFGDSFSSISIEVKPTKLATSAENKRPAGDCTIGSSVDAENTCARNQPVIFPFGAKDPSWLNQILRRVKLSDEDIGVAITLASLEQDANKRARYNMGSA